MRGIRLLTMANLIGFALEATSGFGAPPPRQDEPAEHARRDAKIAQLIADGRLGEALPLAKASLATRERELGARHFDTATSLENLGMIEHRLGQGAEAKGHYERALEIWRGTPGFGFPNMARVQGNVAALLAAAGDVRGARTRLDEMVSLEEKALPEVAGGASEEQNLEFLAALGRSLDRVISFHLNEARDDRGASDLALTTLLLRKGRALEIAFRQNERFRMLLTLGAGLEAINLLNSGADVGVVARSRSKDAPILEELTRARSRYARLSSAPKNAHTGQQVAEAEAEVKRLEEALSDRSQAFDLDGPPITLDALRRQLPPKSALLEFAVYRPFDAKAFGTEAAWAPPRYAVYIVRRAGPIIGVDLGDAVAIDRAAQSLRRAVSERSSDVSTLARALHSVLIEPMLPHLAGLNALQIAPDGELSLLPFETIQDPKGRWLIEAFQLSYLTGGRDLIRLAEKAPRASSPVLLGEVDFDAGRTRANSETTRRWSFLSGALAEMQALAGNGLFRDAIQLSGAGATETALRDVSSPRILHIATHGFFRPSPNPQETGRETLVRAGVVLAGANNGGPGAADDDGLLTALEASTLDLMGTQLVVLSACETGVGVARSGEGVFGLQRAIAVAGARTLVMSAWQVDDEATRALMVAYYKRLARGEGRAQAMRQVQLSMLEGERSAEVLAKARGACPPSGCIRQGDERTTWAHPYYWASFRVTGDIRPIGSLR